MRPHPHPDFRAAGFHPSKEVFEGFLGQIEKMQARLFPSL